MSLKALDELRKCASSGRLHIGTEHQVMHFADAIEAELSERYMELPVDADGVPIHVGDKMEYIATAPFMVCAVAPGVIHAWAETKLGEGKTTEDYPPAQCRHFKPRTIEDVLLDAGVSRACVEDVAAELRELMGGAE